METEMKKALILLALMLFIGMPVMAQDKPKEEPKKEAASDVDAYALYKKKGRTWTWKISAKYSGYESVSYTKQEITEVTDKKATIKTTSMDKDKKETYSSSYDIEFTTTTTDGTAKDAAPKAPEITEETIKVEAGEYECQKMTTEANGMKSTSWTSKKYPGLLVKSESKSDAGESTMELTEFKDA
jgi:galactitol-specific phosphotransferase system IIB component